MRIHTLIALFLLDSVSAQASFVVDASGGPGSQFLSIQAAVQAVPSGSVLVVRAGSYSPVYIDGKGLAILCDAGAAIAAQPSFLVNGPFLTVRNTQPSQVVTVSGLGCGPVGAQFHDGILVENAMGPVVLDGRGATVQPRSLGLVATLRITNSSQVVIRDYELRGGLLLNFSSAPVPEVCCVVGDSAVVFESCLLRGSDSFGSSDQLRFGRAALAATNSRIELVATRVLGGNGVATVGLSGPLQMLADPAVIATNAQLVARGGAAEAIAGGIAPATATQPSVQLDAIAGTGSLRIDPAIPVAGAVASSVLVSTVPNARLTSNVPLLGGSAAATCTGTSGSLIVVALGEPSLASPFPGLSDPLWLGASNSFVVDFGVASAAGEFAVAVPLPGQTGLRGIAFVWQAAQLGPFSVAALSNPSATVIR